MALQFDPEKCIGCKLCQQACSGAHEGVFNPKLARLSVESYYEDEDLKAEANVCTLCGVCVEACPFSALTIEDGRLHLDEEECKNCGICAKKCPQQVIVKKENCVGVCDLCGGDPWCVKYCPHGALSYEEDEVLHEEKLVRGEVR
jgi:carbon-monoxide dehydrogenase iron sulfur subunit